MPDPINLSKFQNPLSQLQRAQGALSSGDTQGALKSMQELINSSTGAPGAPGTNNNAQSLQGLLNDPKVQEALGSLQKGINSPGVAGAAGATVPSISATEDPNTAGNRTLTEDSALNSTVGSDLGLAPLSGGAVAPAFGEVVQGFLHQVSSSQEKSAQMVESLALGESVDVHQVMLALNEANNAMALTLQVRSHALKAYQDLMQISL